MNTTALSFFLKVILAVLVFMPYHKNFRVSLPIQNKQTDKKKHSQFTWNSNKTIAKIDIITMPGLPIYEHIYLSII